MFLAAEGCWMELESIDQPGWTSEVVCNPKISIFIFFLERGGRWGFSLSTYLADHQKLNEIQKGEFHFFGWRGLADGVWIDQPAWPIIRSWMQSKNEHFIVLAGEWWWTGFESIDQPSQSSDVECNPKTSISLFYLERGGGHYSNPLTIPVDHKKFKRNPKMKHFIFLAGDWWQMGFESINLPSQS